MYTSSPPHHHLSQRCVLRCNMDKWDSKGNWAKAKSEDIKEITCPSGIITRTRSCPYIHYRGQLLLYPLWLHSGHFLLHHMQSGHYIRTALQSGHDNQDNTFTTPQSGHYIRTPLQDNQDNTFTIPQSGHYIRPPLESGHDNQDNAMVGLIRRRNIQLLENGRNET